jgi:ubiquitin-conjugating enzyme E2 S
MTSISLLIYPNPESALHEEAGRLLLEHYDDYCRHARLMTSVHGRNRPAVFDSATSAASSAPSMNKSLSNPLSPRSTAATLTVPSTSFEKEPSPSHEKDVHQLPLQPSGISNSASPPPSFSNEGGASLGKKRVVSSSSAAAAAGATKKAVSSEAARAASSTTTNTSAAGKAAAGAKKRSLRRL